MSTCTAFNRQVALIHKLCNTSKLKKCSRTKAKTACSMFKTTKLFVFRIMANQWRGSRETGVMGAKREYVGMSSGSQQTMRGCLRNVQGIDPDYVPACILLIQILLFFSPNASNLTYKVYLLQVFLRHDRIITNFVANSCIWQQESLPSP